MTDVEFVPLIPKDDMPEGWTVCRWDDGGQGVAMGVGWQVENGVLHGRNPRSTWLMSETEYSDFFLEFELKPGEQGNSGCALRAPKPLARPIRIIRLKIANLVAVKAGRTQTTANVRPG